jgi:GAF domain-containing protein
MFVAIARHELGTALSIIRSELEVTLADPDADAAERAWMVVEGVTTMIGLPVVAAGNPVGLLECSRAEPTPWSRLQLRHARIIATVLGPVISSLSARRAAPVSAVSES